MKKHTKASCGHMLAHYNRTANNISNENLDRTRTHLNYNLATHQYMEQNKFVKKRCSEVHCLNRKDVNVMVSWVITAPKNLPEAKHKDFFKASYDFCKNRYGIQNVISAYVHMDETTPHMHFAFVPVVKALKKGKEIEKVSAKECIDKCELRKFHTELQLYLERELDCEVSILNEATKEGNKSIEDLKRENAIERLQKANEKATKIVSMAEMQAKKINDNLSSVKAEYETKKAYVEQAEKISDISVMYPATVKRKMKSLIYKKDVVIVPKDLWEQKHILANEPKCLKEARKKLEKNIQEFSETSSKKHLDTLTQEIENLKNEKKLLEDEVNKATEKNNTLQIELSTTKHEKDKTIEKINEILDKFPELKKEWEEPSKNKNKDFDIEL